VFYDWQAAVGAGTNHKPRAIPRYLLFEGKGRVPELITKSLGRLLDALADLATGEDDIMFIRGFANLNRAKRKVFELHDGLRWGDKRQAFQ